MNNDKVLQLEIDHLREVMDLKFENSEKALRLQASEYERHLSNLNNEAKQLKEMQATYLPRELWNTEHKAIVSIVTSMKDNQNKILITIVVMITAMEIILKFIK